MRALIQVVKEASVTVDGAIVSKIGKGLLVFLGVHIEDSLEHVTWLQEKLLHLRIFKDSEHKMNLSIQEVKGDLLVVSQFTLYADCHKGRRPSFIKAGPPEHAKKLYEHFIAEVTPHLENVETGVFGAHMEVSLVNDGPLTFLLDSDLD